MHLARAHLSFDRFLQLLLQSLALDVFHDDEVVARTGILSQLDFFAAALAELQIRPK